jgi:hypothetical protein
MILKTKPNSASIIYTNSRYSDNGLTLNAPVALNSPYELGGRDLKIGAKPESALIWKIEPTVIQQFRQKPNSALVLGNKPFSGNIYKGYNYTVPTPVGRNSGQPMGLLLCLTYP